MSNRLLAVPDVSEAQLQRILGRVHYVPFCGCWVWPGWSTGFGYGKVKLGGRAYMVHRVVYTALVGPVPEGMVLDHLCRLRLCCNPAHLDPVTPLENTLRGEAVLFGSTHEEEVFLRGAGVSGFQVLPAASGRLHR